MKNLPQNKECSLGSKKTKEEKACNKRALPGEIEAKSGAGVPPMCNLMLNWASGIPLPV